MNISEWCKLRRDYDNLSDDEFTIKAWNYEKQKVREMIIDQEQERFEKKAEQIIEKKIDKDLDKVIKKALMSGKSDMIIKINV